MIDFDIEWMATAASTDEQKAQLAIVLGMAAIGETVAPTEFGKSRVLAYKRLVDSLEVSLQKGELI